MIRVLIADDHPIVRDGLRGVINASSDLQVVGEAGDGPSAVARTLALAPDVVLMDLRMPGGDGLAAIEELTSRADRTRVLVLTTYDSDDDVLRAVRAGATGYLLKDAPVEELLRGIRAAARGESVLAPSVASRLLAKVRTPEVEGPQLSPRELQVLRLVARGTGNRDCARRLFISEATVKTHLQHVYDKLGVGDRAAAVAVGYERGLARALSARTLPRPSGASPVGRRHPDADAGGRPPRGLRRNPVTAEPVSSTAPLNSWPVGCPCPEVSPERWGCRSEPRTRTATLPP